MSCCESCGGITLFKGEDGNTIYNGTSAPTIVANEGDFYIDTATYEIYGPYTGGSWGSGTSLVGPAGPAGADGQGIDHISFTSSTGGGGAGQAGETDTYTVWGDIGETINLGTFSVYNGADGTSAAADYGKTLFVDVVFGNDGTGTRERFDLPFLTISAAITAASAGDTVYVRPGSYTENIILKDGVNIYAELGAILNGQITDNGLERTAEIKGHFQISYTLPNVINVTGTNSNVSIECEEISTIDTGINVRPTPGNSNKLEIKVKRIINLDLDYFLTLRAGARVFIEVYEYFETQATTTPIANTTAIEIGGGGNFTGELHFKCPKVTIGNSVSATGGVFLNENSTNVGNGFIYLDINEIINNYNYATPNELYTVNKGGASRAIFNIGRIVSITRGGLIVNADHPTGYIQFTGKVTSQNEPAFRYTSSQKCIIKNSTLKRNSGGTNDDEAVVIGQNPPGYTGIFNGVNSGYKLEIINSELIKDKGNLAGTNRGVIGKEGSPTVNIKDCDIYGFNTFGGSSATAAALSGNIFFKNTLGNTALDGSVTDTSVAGGFSVDPGLDLYDYID